MIVNRYLLAALVLLTAIGTVSAQQPGLITVPHQPVIVFEKPAEQMLAPQAALSGAPCTQTVCVSEPKKNTKTVYTSRCKEYCVANCSLFNWFSSDCGCCDNCEKKTKHVLVKKTVPDCDTTHCVLKELPVGVPAQTPR